MHGWQIGVLIWLSWSQECPWFYLVCIRSWLPSILRKVRSNAWALEMVTIGIFYHRSSRTIVRAITTPRDITTWSEVRLFALYSLLWSMSSLWCRNVWDDCFGIAALALRDYPESRKSVEFYEKTIENVLESIGKMRNIIVFYEKTNENVLESIGKVRNIVGFYQKTKEHVLGFSSKVREQRCIKSEKWGELVGGYPVNYKGIWDNSSMRGMFAILNWGYSYFSVWIMFGFPIVSSLIVKFISFCTFKLAQSQLKLPILPE